MKKQVTASMLYNLLVCPHRVTMDLFGDLSKQDESNPFVELLWEKGSMFEKEVIEGLQIPFLDLSMYAGEESERLTLEAMGRGESLIYSGRIQDGNLLGIPDLLRNEAGGYVVGDIKSGAGEEGPEDLSKPKKHYAVQLALYTDILERKGLSGGRRGFIWDINSNEVTYDLMKSYGNRNPKTLWQDYEECLYKAISILEQGNQTVPAFSSVCKLCHWYSVCTKRLADEWDLTLIPELGRSKRDTMVDRISNIPELASMNPKNYILGKKTVFPGIGIDTLMKFHKRAKLQTSKNAKPLLHEPIELPDNNLELFFDIEFDPMRDICYLHGFVERYGLNNATKKFVYFFADEPTLESEKAAFTDALHYLRKNQPCTIYYYSKYERTIYRKLQEKYPDVCSSEEIEKIFNPSQAIDLYFDVVKKATDWPTWDFSIKTLAKYLGFSWRDNDPSGAASIEWFDKWVKSRDPQVRKRILEYNEDDCIATCVLLDGINQLKSNN